MRTILKSKFLFSDYWKEFELVFSTSHSYCAQYSQCLIMLHIIIHIGTLWEKSKHMHNMTKASVKYKLQYTFSDTSWSRITKTKNLKLKFWTNLRHMWVEFVVGSLPCSERFFSGYSGFPVSSKTNISKFQFDQESGRRRTTMWMCYLQIFIYLLIYFIFKCSLGMYM